MSPEPADDERWESARRAVVGRWRVVLDRVAARDEAGTLAIANAMDELCQEAVRARLRATGDPDSGDLRCRYCLEYLRRGGCLGLIGALNHQVLIGAWEEAERLVRERLRELTEPVRD